MILSPVIFAVFVGVGEDGEDDEPQPAVVATKHATTAALATEICRIRTSRITRRTCAGRMPHGLFRNCGTIIRCAMAEVRRGRDYGRSDRGRTAPRLGQLRRRRRA